MNIQIKNKNNVKIDPVGATCQVAPIIKNTIKPNTISSIVGQIKTVTTKRIRKNSFQNFQWQRNYYEHVVRDEKDLNEIREYITYNHLKWNEDAENPGNEKI